MKYLNFRLIFILCGVFFIMLSTAWFFGAEDMTRMSTKNIAEDALFMGVGTHQIVGGLFLIFAIMNLSVLRLDDESAKKNVTRHWHCIDTLGFNNDKKLFYWTPAWFL